MKVPGSVRACVLSFAMTADVCLSGPPTKPDMTSGGTSYSIKPKSADVRTGARNSVRARAGVRTLQDER